MCNLLRAVHCSFFVCAIIAGFPVRWKIFAAATFSPREYFPSRYKACNYCSTEKNCSASDATVAHETTSQRKRRIHTRVSWNFTNNQSLTFSRRTEIFRHYLANTYSGKVILSQTKRFRSNSVKICLGVNYPLPSCNVRVNLALIYVCFKASNRYCYPLQNKH